jgi:hypothetical protein
LKLITDHENQTKDIKEFNSILIRKIIVIQLTVASSKNVRSVLRLPTLLCIINIFTTAPAADEIINFLTLARVSQSGVLALVSRCYEVHDEI